MTEEENPAQRVWMAHNSVDDDEAVMFFTEMPGGELKERFVLKEYLCTFVRVVD